MSDTARSPQPYARDLSTKEWERLKPLVPIPKHGGRPAKYERLEIINAILYLIRTSFAWRLLPHDFTPGGLFIITSPPGDVMAPGQKSTTHYTYRWALLKDANLSQAQPSWTANRLKQPKKGGPWI